MISFFNKKKAHYKEAIISLKKFIWNMEFDVMNLRVIREGFRLQYDALEEKVTAFQERIKKLEERNTEGDSQEIEHVAKIIENYNHDLQQLREQMQAIDNEIEGFDYTDDKNTPRRHEGILEKISKHNTKIELLKEYIKSF